MPFKYQMIAITDVGQVREHNEDSLRIMPHLNLAVVADGMGGHQSGEVASRMAVGALSDYLEEQVLILDAVDDDVVKKIMPDAFALANSQVYTSAHQMADCEGMGTTLVAGLFQPDRICIGHVGDSRFYQFHHGELKQLTVDHTLAMELAATKPDEEVPEYSHHVLRRALGIESSCRPDFMTAQPENGQVYLLCSDGLTGVVSDHDIATILTLRSNQPEACAESLIRTCIENGAPDNVSVLLVFVKA